MPTSTKHRPRWVLVLLLLGLIAFGVGVVKVLVEPSSPAEVASDGHPCSTVRSCLREMPMPVKVPHLSFLRFSWGEYYFPDKVEGPVWAARLVYHGPHNAVVEEDFHEPQRTPPCTDIRHAVSVTTHSGLAVCLLLGPEVWYSNGQVWYDLYFAADGGLSEADARSLLLSSANSFG